MNKIHSKIWSKSLGTTIVASEFAKASGKGGSAKRMRAGVAALSLAMGMTLLATSVTSALAADNTTPPTTQQATPQISVPAPSSSSAIYFSADGAGDGSDNALSLGTNSTAGGALSSAYGAESTALGYNSLANDDYSTAVGGNSQAIGVGSSAIGHSAFTGAAYAT
ncbi:MAG TPA: ESPR-type extended signal peptide-containing protein, partial [Dyella sp.]